MNIDTLITVAPGITVFMFFMGIYKLVLEKKMQAKEYVGELLGNKKTTDGVHGKAAADMILKRRGSKDAESFIYKLEDKLERANMPMLPNEFVMLSIGSGFTGLILSLLLFFSDNIFLAFLSGIGSAFIPNLYMNLKIFFRMKKASAQFADVLDSMVNGFKTGFGFNRAVQMIADNYGDPWGTEFGKMAAEMSLGATQEDALYALSKRIPTPDVDLFVTAMMIQKETGGNLSELLGTLSKTIRDRYKLFQKVGAISAQGKLSACIVACVPFALAGLMFLFLPHAMTQFVSHPIGQVLLGVAGFWMCCGFGVLYKIVNIEV